MNTEGHEEGHALEDLEIRYAAEYARDIYEKMQLLKNAADMANEKLIDTETKQRIIDHQKKLLARNIDRFKVYLGIE